jgi:Icc-related predicted phosphoesterase
VRKSGVGQNILFTTGIHGDYRLLRELLAAIEKEAADVVILGGDVFPKVDRSLAAAAEAQREFLTESFIPFFDDVLRGGKRLLVIHPGNNDLRHPTFNQVKKWSRGKKGQVIVGEDGLFKNVLSMPLLCYPFIPPTPCAIKDWEKWDDTGSRVIPVGFFKGFRSSKSSGVDIAPMILSPKEDGNTIRSDLEVRSHAIQDLEFVFLAQAPPGETALDFIDAGEHGGSLALRDFIKSAQPKVSLHGHAHRSVEFSKRFFIKLNRTISINPGQARVDSEEPFHYVTFQLQNVLATLKHSVYGQAV